MITYFHHKTIKEHFKLNPVVHAGYHIEKTKLSVLGDNEINRFIMCAENVIEVFNKMFPKRLEIVMDGGLMCHQDGSQDMFTQDSDLSGFWLDIQGANFSAPINPDRISISVTLNEGFSDEYYKSVVAHELLHSLGFNHPVERNTYLKNEGFFSGKRYYIYNDDEIHGIDTLYSIETEGNIKVGAYLEDNKLPPYTLRWEAFLYDLEANSLMYQSPIDRTGYAEFTIREDFNNLGDKVRLFVFDSFINQRFSFGELEIRYWKSPVFKIRDLKEIGFYYSLEKSIKVDTIDINVVNALKS